MDAWGRDTYAKWEREVMLEDAAARAGTGATLSGPAVPNVAYSRP